MMHMLIVDDEEFVRLVLERSLRAEGCEVVSVGSGQEAIERLKSTSFDGLITDLRMPGVDGRGLLRWVKEYQPEVEVIVLTGHGDVKDAVEAMREGAWDFLVKETPFDGTAVTAALAKLRTIRTLRRENLAARRGGYHDDRVVEGGSEVWQDLMTQVVRVAVARAPVLIQGETGSGKEVVARLLHARGPRMSGPFLAVNCGAVNRELLESELFGHEKGAFTGAGASKQGLIAAAEGGTLFLDEIGDMPGPMQVGLLRFLDQGEFRPVGSTRTLRADVRVIAATNRDLQDLVHQGRFRDDLLYRINTVTLRVPPLRERTEDLPPLIEHILRTLRVPGSVRRSVSPDGLAALCAYRWPGNVRELRNVLERIVLLHPDAEPIGRAEVQRVLPAAPALHSPDDPTTLSLEEVEQRHILRVLDAQGGNRTQAAKILRIDYKTLLGKLKKYGVGETAEGGARGPD